MNDINGSSSKPPAFIPYPMPPDTLFLPSLAALLNPLNTSPESDTSSLSSSFSTASNSNKSPSTASTPSSTGGGVRTIRCRVCMGCLSQPCGKCCYCVDSLPFGGPGVKKQTCIERKCVVLLENRIQRETTKVRTGCNKCVGCKLPECQSCLVCYDKKFLNGKYLTGAICSKKKCVEVSSFELSMQELKKLQQKRQRKTPAKRAPKPKIQKEKVKTEAPNPKPKRVYKRRPRKLPTVSSAPPPILGKQVSNTETTPVEENETIHGKQQGSNDLLFQKLASDAPPRLSPASNYAQSFETSEIQQSQIVPQNYYSSPNNYQFQHIDLHKPWSHKVMPKSLMNSQTCQQTCSNYFDERGCYRRFHYLRFSNNFDPLSTEFDPFIPPSYSGNGEVILQAL